jgi:hypothetical protein
MPLTHPRVIKVLAHRVPRIGLPLRDAYHAWLRSRFHRGWDAANAEARRALHEAPPTLTPVQQRVLDDLSGRGVAHVHFEDLVGDGARWDRLSAEVARWLESGTVRDREHAYRELDYQTARWKEYIIMQRGAHSMPVIPWDDPWLQLGLAPAVLDIVNSYLDLCAKLMYVDLWDTIAVNRQRPLTGSQQWHRDPDDVRLVKIFLYFTDVDAGAGPLHYVPYSRRGDKYGWLWPQKVAGSNYPPAAELEQAIPPSEWAICAHPAGTFVFVDTTGFHMGGRATARNRVFATWEYASHAAFGRYFEPGPPPAASRVSEAARFALWHRPEA